MSKKKKILFIACMPYYKEKGSTLRTHATLQNLSQNYTIDALVYAHGEKISIPDVQIHRTPFWYMPKLAISKPTVSKVILDFFVLIKSFKLLLTNSYTHIHAEDFEAATIGYILSKIFHKPFVYNLHNRIVDNWSISGKKPPKIISWIEKVVIKNSKFIILNWDIYKQDSAFDNKKFFLHYDSVTLASQKASMNLPKNYLFYAGNFEKYQGIELFLEAYSDSQCDIPLLLAGSATEDITNKINKMNLQEKVKLLGRCNVEETNTLIKNSTYCILPRIAGKQPSMKLIHYLSWEKPIIANDIICNHEILKKYNNIGIFYENKKDLVNILNNISTYTINKKNLYQAAQYIQNNSDPNTFIKNYKSLL
jgi:glycosyltransferase involved in cell wall biosynthesis